MISRLSSGPEMDGNFESWLKQLLDSHGVDGEVFGEYISGTLSTIEDPEEDEITENLSDILAGCVEDEATCATITTAITEKWMTKVATRKAEADKLKEKEMKQLSEAAEKATISEVRDVPSQKQQAIAAELGGLSEAEKKRLVAQYDCESDGDSDAEVRVEEVKESRGKAIGTTSMQGLFQNTNAYQVKEAERQRKRDQKATHEAKVERDRKSREAQKQKAQDRKEKEKKRTQKQERRR